MDFQEIEFSRDKNKDFASELISNHFEAASNDILELQLSCSFQNLEIWKVVKRKFPYFGQWLQWTVPVFSHPKPWWKLICLQDKNDICERLRDKHCFIFRYKQFWIYFSMTLTWFWFYLVLPVKIAKKFFGIIMWKLSK